VQAAPLRTPFSGAQPTSSSTVPGIRLSAFRGRYAAASDFRADLTGKLAKPFEIRDDKQLKTTSL
jgi:hypothetical protein